MYYLLRYTFQYGEDQIRLLIDGENGQAPRATQVPSKANIIAGIQWLLAGTQAGDDTLFHFSGYGAQHPQKPGSELHEAYIVPADFAADLPVDFFFTKRAIHTTPDASSEQSERATVTCVWVQASFLCRIKSISGTNTGSNASNCNLGLRLPCDTWSGPFATSSSRFSKG